MADSKTAILLTLKHEGGYQNNPADTGNWYNGINYGTKYGITPKDVALYFPQLISDPNCIRNLTEDQAVYIYQQGYWKQGYSQINDQSVANKLFDMGVLMGVKTAVRLLQTAMSNAIHIVADGEFGPETLEDVNAVSVAGDLLGAYRNVLHNHLISIVTATPSKAQFLTGWTARVNS